MPTATPIPGPGGLQGLARGLRFGQDPLGTLTEWQRSYGDMMQLRAGPQRFVWVFHPDLAREVLITQAKRFRRRGRQVEVLRQWDGDGLVTSDGERWLRGRRLVQPAFHHARFPAYARAMAAAGAALAARWADGAPAELELNAAMTDLTLSIMADTFFGADLSAEARRLGEAVATLSEVAMRETGRPFALPDWLPLPGVRRKRATIAYLNGTIDGLIAARRGAGDDRGDLLSMLLAARDEEGDGRGLSDLELRHEVMTLFMAGHDTTAGTLPWIWYLLAAHPEAEARLQAEVDTVLEGRLPTAEDLPRLAYTQQVVKETLRLYPQAYVLFARVAAEDLELGGYAIPAGSQVFPVPYLIHHDARWFPDPERFDPDRFLPEREKALRPCAWIPFGAGPRACIGAAFATMEMVLIVATIAARLRLTPAEGQGRPEPHALFSLRPKGGLRMRAERRG